MVFLHILRQFGFVANLPSGLTLEEYIQGIDGHTFMYGTGEDGTEVDGILLRDDQPDLKETILRLLAQIYCRRYEVDGGFFYRDFCDHGDELDQMIMKAGYAIWSGYITERMVDKVTGREVVQDAVGDDVMDVTLTGDESAMSWIILNGGSDKLKGTCAAVKNQGDDIRIDYDFIHRLGALYLLESYQLRLDEIRRRS